MKPSEVFIPIKHLNVSDHLILNNGKLVLAAVETITLIQQCLFAEQWFQYLLYHSI